jgi:predicted transposase/invertase (TIGR01784 family)
MDDISHPHDRFFKNTMSQINVAKLFFQQYLPEKVLSAINLDTLSISKSSYIDKHLKLVESDLLFSVNTNDTKSYIYLFIIGASKHC